MESFEKGWGWFYWTWETEDAVQWSWRRGVLAGILPQKAGVRGDVCGQSVGGFDGLPENY